MQQTTGTQKTTTMYHGHPHQNMVGQQRGTRTPHHKTNRRAPCASGTCSPASWLQQNFIKDARAVTQRAKAKKKKMWQDDNTINKHHIKTTAAPHWHPGKEKPIKYVRTTAQ